MLIHKLRNCAQGAVERPTFKRDFNHIPLHNLWTREPLIRGPISGRLRGEMPSCPQALPTGLPAFLAYSPQSYPQAVLRVSEPLPTVVFGTPGGDTARLR